VTLKDTYIEADECRPTNKTKLKNHRNTESQNVRVWKGPLWVI